jgi:hypothetical protein
MPLTTRSTLQLAWLWLATSCCLSPASADTIEVNGVKPLPLGSACTADNACVPGVAERRTLG